MLRNKLLLQFPYFGKFPIKIFGLCLGHKQKIFIRKFSQNLKISLHNLLRNKSNTKPPLAPPYKGGGPDKH